MGQPILPLLRTGALATGGQGAQRARRLLEGTSSFLNTPESFFQTLKAEGHPQALCESAAFDFGSCAATWETEHIHTLGPGFPVMPRGPLSPRGPWIQGREERSASALQS